MALKKKKTTKKVAPVGANNNKSNRENWFATGFSVLLWGAILGTFGHNYFGLGDPELEIVFAANPTNADDKDPGSWLVSGHLIYDGRFVSNVGVWAIATDKQGNRLSTGKTLTDKAGKFELATIPNSISGQKDENIIEISVRARGEILSADTKDKKKIKVGPSSAKIGLQTEQRFRIISLPIKELMIIMRTGRRRQ